MSIKVDQPQRRKTSLGLISFTPPQPMQVASTNTEDGRLNSHIITSPCFSKSLACASFHNVFLSLPFINRKWYDTAVPSPPFEGRCFYFRRWYLIISKNNVIFEEVLVTKQEQTRSRRQQSVNKKKWWLLALGAVVILLGGFYIFRSMHYRDHFLQIGRAHV